MKTIFLSCWLLAAGCWLSACAMAPTVNPIVNAACTVESDIAGGFTGIITAAGNCSHPDVIQNDLLISLGKANFCATAKTRTAHKPKKGIIGDIACPSAVATGMALLKPQVKPTWGCKFDTSSDLSAALLAACQGIIQF
jgi:hypothetical protein